MATRTMNLLSSSCIFLILIAIPLFAHAKSPSPFEFINHLQGCKKGENVKDLHKLKSYLHRFGYLNNNVQNTANDDDFDDKLEAALKTYQLNYHLNATGVLDADTASKMTMPRCGVPDISNGTNHMRTKKKPHHHGNRKTLHTVSHYKFFSGEPKWPSSKSHLTYGFYQNVNPDVKSAVGRAFDKWVSATGYFSFSQVDDAGAADLKIGFERGNHGDGSSFNGAGGVLAHAFAPTDGRFHYDADERWSVGAVAGAFDLETVALHEIGHLLGLDHSDDANAIMLATIPSGATKGLGADDIQGIKALYNV